MSKRYPREFRDDVVRVALARDPGVSLARIAADFGVGKSSLQNWIREASEAVPATTSAEVPSEALEARELRRRVKLLEQENEVLRRAAAYFAQAHLPGKSSKNLPLTVSPSR